MQEMLQQMQQKLKVAGTDDAPKVNIKLYTLHQFILIYWDVFRKKKNSVI